MTDPWKCGQRDSFDQTHSSEYNLCIPFDKNMLHCQVSLPVYKDTHRDTNTDIELYKHMFWVDRLYVYIYIYIYMDKL